jgi:hypothetical protein
MKITVTPGKVRSILEAIGQSVLPEKILADELTPAQNKAVADLFPPWKVGEDVLVGALREYEGELYECLQDRTTQSDWTPDTSESLWKSRSAPGTIPAWEQPTGAHDAYNTGDQVTHNDKIWESTIDGNTTEPGTEVEHGYWVEV